ncbi:MAG: DUF1553 domain-containing protein [Opitutus sp.]|nr:DUF1553 domain-containing protein [Opitutus sp.]
MLPVAVTAAPAVIDFNRDIRPILSDKCFRCHGPDEGNRKGGEHGLRLDTRVGATTDLGGGGFAIVSGRPDQSELLARITNPDEEEHMPPAKTGKTLAAHEIDLLRRWIADGAPYAAHWSYEKPRRVAPPAVKDTAWPKGALDRFILARLEQAGLRPQPEADRAALARRVALDLTGLPPSLAEVESMVGDRSADAYERFVDRQLAKPAYGEHWARLWLDLARYADSKGYADDQPRSIWRYRDYVIDALNRNVPFDQFTVEQLAGDLLPDATPEQIFATGFHRNTMNNTEGGTIDEEFRSVAVVDRVNTTMAVWMGTSIACAQCHTHKYDPLTLKEYFQLYAIFNQTEDADRNDETPVVDFFSDDQKKERDAATAEIVALSRTMLAGKTAHVAAAQKWAREFPLALDWRWANPAAIKSKSGAVIMTEDGGRVRVAPGKKTDTYTLELPASGEEKVTALRLESLPLATLPGGGAGGAAGGNFVVTRLRAAIRPAEPMRAARFVRVELPGGNRVLPLAEVQVFSAGENVAPRGVASQSSTAEGAVAARAIDGRTDGDVAKQSISVTETGENPWWEVDLGATLPLERVVVWGRTGLEPTVGGLRVSLLDEQRQPVWEQVAAAAPKPSRTFSPGDPREVKLVRVVTDFAQDDFDEALVVTEQVPKGKNARKRVGPKTGWSVEGAADRGHTLSVEPEKPLVLKPGEALVVTIEQQSDVANATLNHFRFGVTTDARAREHLQTPAAEFAALVRPEAERDAAQHKRLLDHYLREVAPEFRKERQRVTALQRTLDEMPLQSSPVLRELPADKQRKTHVQLRGNYLALGDEVSGGVPAAFPPLPGGAPANRLSLARWLVDPENPLTARVQANRLWESIFGLGIVRTSEEFGSQGEPPSHPELLDWLAVDLVENHWDLKRFVKQLVMSAAYRQSSRVTPAALEADPENRLLSRGPRFRLGAETVRDQALAVSGLLNPRMHGPSSKPFQPAFGLSAAFGSALDWKTSTGADRLRRGLYTEWRRSSPYPSMVTFDAPNREVCTLRRTRSNTPLQALVTLNDPVYVEAAQALARLIAAEGATPAEKVRAGFLRVLLRAPSQAELKPLIALYGDALASYSAAPDRATALIANAENPPPASLPPAELAAWTAVANVLLNLDETLMKR